MLLVCFDDDLETNGEQLSVDEIRLSHLKQYLQEAAMVADSVIFQRDLESKSLKERGMPSSSNILTNLFSRSDAIN